MNPVSVYACSTIAMPIYYGIEATKKVLTADGWYKSGDIGYMDAEGFLYVKDRSEFP